MIQMRRKQHFLPGLRRPGNNAAHNLSVPLESPGLDARAESYGPSGKFPLEISRRAGRDREGNELSSRFGRHGLPRHLIGKRTPIRLEVLPIRHHAKDVEPATRE